MQQIIKYTKDNFYITTDFNDINIEQVCSLLSKSHWANSRSKDKVIKSLKNSLCFSLFDKNIQIGLLRVITDYSTFAYISDVIVDEKYRNNGLGQWILSCVFEHPELKDLNRWILLTTYAKEFYKKFGFDNIKYPEKYMELSTL